MALFHRFKIASALALLIMPLSAGRAASLSVWVDARINGSRPNCLALHLVPRTPAIAQQFQAFFGTRGAGARRLDLDLVQQASRRPLSATDRVSDCHSWGPQFEHVAPGEYYITAFIKGGSAGSTPFEFVGSGSSIPGLREQAYYLVQPVTVTASADKVQVILKAE